MPFTVVLGAGASPGTGVPAGTGTGALSIALPLLGGDGLESLFPEAVALPPDGRWSLARAEGWLLGAARIAPAADLAGATRRIYAELLGLARGRNLARIWNYVPRINASGPDGLENYQAFCRGRSLAFEAEFGSGFPARLPAASAVGTPEDALAVIFAASTAPVEHRENPRQVPAYDYPAEHGPRSPSFARATVVREGAPSTVFISGTAAIAGHATLAPGDTAAQVEATLENLRLISRACGLGPDLGAGSGAVPGVGPVRHFKVYLRQAGDFAAVARRLSVTLIGPGDRAAYLQADICRAALNVEIEASIRGAVLPR
jgi:enamine deaminase RidA (YjgF/YER057c/UK114 family)